MTQEDVEEEWDEEEIHIEQAQQEWDNQHQETQTPEDPDKWYTLGVYPDDSETKSIEEDDREVVDHEWILFSLNCPPIVVLKHHPLVLHVFPTRLGKSVHKMHQLHFACLALGR